MSGEHWTADFLWARLRWWLLGIAIVHQSAAYLCENYVTYDLAQQIGAARAILDGHNFGLPKINETDFSNTARNPVVQWPPGYSMMFAIVLSIVPDFWIVDGLFYSLGVILFFSAWFAILETVSPVVLGSRGKLILWLFWAFAWQLSLGPWSLHTRLISVEILSIGAFSWGLWFTIRCTSSRWWIVWALAAGAGAGLAASLRYAYWPLCSVFPLSLMLVGLTSQRRWQHLGAAVLSAVIPAGCLALMLLFLYKSTGRVAVPTGYTLEPDFHLDHLLRFAPFPAWAIGFPDTWGWLTRLIPGLGQLPVRPIAWLVSVPVLAAALTPLLRSLPIGWKIFRDAKSPRDTLIFVFGGSLSAAWTIGLLSHSSIFRTACHAPGSPVDWTFVQEMRYFIPIVPFLCVGVARFLEGLLFPAAGQRPGWRRVGCMALVVGWFLIATAARMEAPIAHAVDHRQVRTKTRAEADTARAVYSLVRQHLAEGRPVLFLYSGPLPFHALPIRAARMAGAAIDWLNSTKGVVASSGPVAVITIVFDDEPVEPQPDRLGVADRDIDPDRWQRVTRVHNGWLCEVILPGSGGEGVVE
jgi:hypothetical protein